MPVKELTPESTVPSSVPLATVTRSLAACTVNSDASASPGSVAGANSLQGDMSTSFRVS
jgi:hypothetical protein